MFQTEGAAIIEPAKGHPVWVHQTTGVPGGHYSTQHDSFLVSADSLSGKGAFRKLFAETSQALEQELDKDVFAGNGSTAVLASLEDGKLTTAHLGDSRATLFIRDLKTGKVTPVQLTEDHKPDRYDEGLRLDKYKDICFVKKNVVCFRTGGHIALTRAFGDAALRGIVIDEPEIETHRLSMYAMPETEIYLCVDSDGAHDRTTQQERAQALEKHFKNPKGNPAEILSRLAMNNGSKDNITVLLTKIDPALKEKLLLGVFDGHGEEGCRISTAAAGKVAKFSAAAP